MDVVQRRCGFAMGIEISPQGSKGDLCLAWKQEVKVELKSSGNFFIDAMVYTLEEDVT